MAASQSLALAVTGPGDSPAPAESPTRRLDSFQFPSFQVRSLSLPVSSLARPAASHAGGPAVEEPGRPFKLRPRAGPLAVGAAAEPSARRTRSSGSSLSSLSRTQASVPSLRARLRLGCQPEPGPAARGATGSLSDCSSWSCAACAAATPSDGTVLPQAGPAPPSAGAGAGGTVTGPQPEI